MSVEVIDVINDNDEVINQKARSEVQKGDKLRYIQVYLFDKDGNMLIQQRQEGRKRANLLDPSVAGHVKSGESYKDAALREMQEELAVQCDIELVGDFSGHWGTCHLFKGTLSQDVTPSFAEVKRVFFWPMLKVYSHMRQYHWMFCEGFLAGLQFFNGHYFRPLTHVNEKDEVLGTIDYAEMNQKSLPVRVVHVYIKNKKGEFLFQQRAPFVQAPYCLDEAATGHVDLGETYEEAASRELYEELGVDYTFTEKDEIHHGQLKHNNKFVKCYMLEYDGEFKVDSGEVENIAWLKLDDVKKMMQQAPFLFTNSSVELHELCYEKLK